VGSRRSRPSAIGHRLKWQVATDFRPKKSGRHPTSELSYLPGDAIIADARADPLSQPFEMVDQIAVRPETDVATVSDIWL
jgi:hypothetical protein